MIHTPQFIILDEPFSGLDPVNAYLLEVGIRRLRDQGSAIIYSSHDMRNVEAISDRLVMLKNGAVVLSATHQGYIPEFSQQAPSLDEIFRMKVEA